VDSLRRAALLRLFRQGSQKGAA